MKYRRLLMMLLPALALAAVRPDGARGTLRLTVTDAATGRPSPCRITVVDSKGEPAEFVAARAPWLAMRRSVIYTSTGHAELSLPVGRYTVYATRGPAYGLAQVDTEVAAGVKSLAVTVRREVDTQGWVSCDTHVHTLTFSGHGDCAIEERLVTLAGEQVDLPIATDHETPVDYRRWMAATRTEGLFTPVIGDEVTTKEGHFNAFPLQPGAAHPSNKITEWRALLASIRATPGVKAVILNHPSNLHNGFRPTDPQRFNPVTGDSLDGRDWAVDGVEVLNSSAMQSDWMKPFRDWFALLNHGRRVTGVGSSDCHDVDRFIVGQGRTYLASRTPGAGSVNVNDAIESLKAGRALVSLGLFTDLAVDGRFHVGDLATPSGNRLRVRVVIRAPGWIEADRVEVYLNGEIAASRVIPPGAEGRPQSADLLFDLPRPAHDVWIAAIASGPGVTAPYWPVARPYQPTRAAWEPRVIGATNPIWVDGDGDGRYTSPRDYARRLVKESAGELALLFKSLAKFDSATAAQAASVCREKGFEPASGKFSAALESAAPQVQQGFKAFLAHTIAKG